MGDKRDKAPAGPDVSAKAEDNAAVRRVTAVSGRANLQSKGGSTIEDIDLGGDGASKLKGWRWWAEKLWFPIIVVIVAGALAYFFGPGKSTDRKQPSPNSAPSAVAPK